LNGAVAQRYAEALAGVAFERNIAGQVKGDLSAFIEAFYSAADLRHVLESPSVGRDLKRKVVEAVAAKMNLDQSVCNFIHLIVDHRRTEALREIEEAFRAAMNAKLGIADAQVTSARALSAEEKAHLVAALTRRTGKKIEARFQEDKSLFGGAVVQVGSTVYDGSIREQLTRLREQLESE